MEIEYQREFDNWVAGELFHVEELTALKKQDQKGAIILLMVFFVVGLMIYLSSNKDGVDNLLLAILVFWVGYLYVQIGRSKRRIIYDRLRIACGQQIDSIPDKRVRWQAGPDQFVMCDSEKEIRTPWASIRKVSLCPQYLFVQYGAIDHAVLPKEGICEGDYDAFVRYFIDRYQDCANQQNVQATIVKSEWTVDIHRLKKGNPWKLSIRKLCFMVLWWLVFVVCGGVLLYRS